MNPRIYPQQGAVHAPLGLFRTQFCQAVIYAPGASFPVGTFSKASLQEGERILLKRARAAIDERQEHGRISSRRQAQPVRFRLARSDIGPPSRRLQASRLRPSFYDFCA